MAGGLALAGLQTQGTVLRRVPSEESMHAQLMPAAAGRVERPWYALLAIVLEVFTAVLAIPVGLMFLSDPSGSAMGLPKGWIEATVFGSYVIPGLYLLFMNGVGMLVVAGLTVVRHPMAPWLTGVLGTGLVIWILVQVVVMPEVMWLQGLFLVIGVVLGLISLAWLRRTGQLRLW
jgi:hypothetical protein